VTMADDQPSTNSPVAPPAVEPPTLDTAAIVMTGRHGGPWDMYLTEPAEVERLLGGRLLAAFLRCFVGIDKILTLEQAIGLNRDHVGYENPGGERNLALLASMLTGIMHEMGYALQELKDAGADAVVAEYPQFWDPLEELRAKWHTRQDTRRHTSEVRNQLAFHLGFPKTYAAGLKRAVEVDPRRLHLAKMGAPENRFGAYFHGARAVLGWGMRINNDELGDVIHQTRDGHEQVPTLLYQLFRVVLAKSGIRYIDQRQREPAAGAGGK
jgi:hypothetical protein